MGFYIRLNLEANGAVPRQVAAEVVIPGQEALKLSSLGTEAIEKAFKDSFSNNLPLVGIIFKGVAAPLPITESGIAELRVNVDGREQICATLNIKIS
ncbi:hypothetical protein [Rhodopseudomonas sp. P2A-2r]|uniref:hypothetical protein n=1 Tax=unclassified Rhodopseudomonas TaxID=2638247 RepID=UPI0022349EC8|nr:hypothetical protein [Rhodopseudomonas sp. P2A-2r]UZE51368.1 hypothetical protein ONR75_12600 [Rhodopseudomonas sp. P2A-2r]